MLTPRVRLGITPSFFCMGWPPSFIFAVLERTGFLVKARTVPITRTAVTTNMALKGKVIIIWKRLDSKDGSRATAEIRAKYKLTKCERLE